MSILQSLGEKCAEKTYEMALGTMEKSADDCLFFLWHEAEYPQELLEIEE